MECRLLAEPRARELAKGLPRTAAARSGEAAVGEMGSRPRGEAGSLGEAGLQVATSLGGRGRASLEGAGDSSPSRGCPTEPEPSLRKPRESLDTMSRRPSRASALARPSSMHTRLDSRDSRPRPGLGESADGGNTATIVHDYISILPQQYQGALEARMKETWVAILNDAYVGVGDVQTAGHAHWHGFTPLVQH